MAILGVFRFEATAPVVFFGSPTAFVGFFFETVFEADTLDLAGVFIAITGEVSAGALLSAISIPKTSARSPAAMVFLPRDLAASAWAQPSTAPAISSR